MFSKHETIGPILDFQTAPTDTTKNKMANNYDLSQCLNQISASETTNQQINFLCNKIYKNLAEDKSFNPNKDFVEKLFLVQEPIVTINNDNIFILADWAKNLLPKSTHKDIKILMQTLCELSFRAVFKENGEYQDDFKAYMDLHFGEEALENSKDITRRHELLNSASQVFTVSFLHDLPKEKQEKELVIIKIFGKMTNALIPVLKFYLQMRFGMIHETNANHLLKITEQITREKNKLDALIETELNIIKKDLEKQPQGQSTHQFILTNAHLNTKKIMEWTQVDIQNICKNNKPEYAKIFSEKKFLIQALEARDALNLLFSTTINSQLSAAQKVEELSIGLQIHSLKMECLHYKEHLLQMRNATSQDNPKRYLLNIKMDNLSQQISALTSSDSSQTKLKKFIDLLKQYEAAFKTEQDAVGKKFLKSIKAKLPDASDKAVPAKKNYTKFFKSKHQHAAENKPLLPNKDSRKKKDQNKIFNRSSH